MCEFLSAIVMRSGDILTHDATDSHELLAKHFKLKEHRDSDKGVNGWVKVEFCPPNYEYDQPDKYALRLDEDSAPAWWDAEMVEKVTTSLRAMIERMIVSANEELLLGGRHIVASGSRVDMLVGGTAIAYGSSTVRAYGSSMVTAYGISTVTAYDRSMVTAYDSSTVRACESSTVTACDSSTVTARDRSTVTACDRSTVMACDSSTVRAYGGTVIDKREVAR